MLKLIDIQLPDGSIIQKEVIACEGYLDINTMHIKVHVTPENPIKKRKVKNPPEQTEMKLNDPRKERTHAKRTPRTP